jgi:hypothetical protein
MKFKMMKNLYLKKIDKEKVDKEKGDFEEKELLINNINKKNNDIDITGGSILSRNKYKDKKRIKLNI